MEKEVYYMENVLHRAQLQIAFGKQREPRGKYQLRNKCSDRSFYNNLLFFHSYFLAVFSMAGQVFKIINDTKEAEDAYDIVSQRNLPKPSGVIVSITAIIKGALGSGILSGHAAYKSAGFLFALPMNIILGAYMTFCLYMLGMDGQTMCRRLGRPFLTYPELAEAAVACFPSPKLSKWSRVARHAITTCIVLELFGACSTYQLIIAKTIKQLVENTPTAAAEPAYPGYPSMRMYLLMMVIPLILICWVRHLQWLAPFTILGNFLVLLAIVTTIYYSMKINPGFIGMKAYTDLAGGFKFTGMIVFSMSCAGIAISIENNMANPKLYPLVISTGMFFVTGGVALTSLFGYNAYLEDTKAPITLNFPMETLPMILKGAVAVMIYVTHALNFFVPFMLVFTSIGTYHNQEKLVMWEYFYRTVFVCAICFLAFVFPSIADLMGFLGACFLSNLAFIFPNLIHLLVNWHRPGLGKMRWRLWRAIALLAFGIFLWVCGTAVNTNNLVKVFTG